jgi:hypothetical protein
MWQEQGKRQVSGTLKQVSLAKGRKTPTEKLRIGGFLGVVKPTPLKEYTLMWLTTTPQRTLSVQKPNESCWTVLRWAQP